jgi:hypothetical protein
MFIVRDIPIASVNPENKDYERSLGLASDSDDTVPSSTKAIKMSKLIKDPLKLVRRSKAVVGIWGTEDHEGEVLNQNVWFPFKKALKDMGFTEDQIRDIENFEIDEENL